MDRNELTLAIAGALIAAFLLGWVARWIVGRTNGPVTRSAAQDADLAVQLHAAEDARHRAETLRDEIEAAAAQQIATLQSELAAAQEAATRAEAEVEEVRASYRRVLRPRPPPLETD